MTESIYNTNVSWVDKIYRKNITFEEPLEVGEEYLLTVNSGKIHNLDIFDGGELIGSLRNNKLSFVAERETDTLILRYYEHVDPISWKITLERKHETPSGLNYAKEYQLTKALDPEQRYMITVEATSVDKLGVWLGREYFAGYMEDNSLIVTGFDKAYDSIVIKSSSKNTRIDTVMMTRGVKFEDWLPTPEDTDNRFSLIKQTVDEIIHRVGDNEGNISEVVQTAEKIAQTVKDDRRDLESQIVQTAEGITQTVRDNKRNLQSEIKQTAEEISARVSNNRNDISKVDIKTDNISARVSNNRNDISKVNIEAGRISTRVSDNSGRISGFEQTATNIRIRLTDVEDNPISGINLSREGAQIHGDKIDLYGLVSIWNRDGSSRTQIDGDKITAGTIHGDKITANTIHGNRIRAGTISADKVGAGLLEGNTIITSTDARNYIHMKEQMLTFIAGSWEKMQIGYSSANSWNEEPFIRMGVGDHAGRDVFKIEKNTSEMDMYYRSNWGTSRLKMKLNGDVEFTAGRNIVTSGPVKFSQRELMALDSGVGSSPFITLPYTGYLSYYSYRTGSNALDVRNDIGGSSNQSIRLPGHRHYTTSSSANMRVTDMWNVVRVTSARKYKRDIEEIEDRYADNFFYNAKPVWFKSKGKADNPKHSYYGYIADDVAKIEPRLVSYSSYGEVEGFAYDRVPALLHKVMLKQSDRISELESKVDAIFNKLKNS